MISVYLGSQKKDYPNGSQKGSLVLTENKYFVMVGLRKIRFWCVPLNYSMNLEYLSKDDLLNGIDWEKSTKLKIVIKN